MNDKKNKSEGIKEKTIIEKFEKIYSNHMNSKLAPKFIKEKPPYNINLNEGDYLNINDNDEKNMDYKNITNYITRKSSSDINIDNKELDFDSQDDNKKNQIMKSLIESSKELLSKKILEKEFNNKKKIKEDNESIIIEDDYDTNNENNNEINEIKDMKENIYKDKVMKDIYRHVYKLSDNDNSFGEKKFDVNNPYERLYNQGFFTKNKSQINILNKLDKIKKNSNQKNISKNSQVLISKNKNNMLTKYDKNNIYKPTKSKTKIKNIDLPFRPKINDKSVKIAEKMEESFLRLTKPKYKEKIETPKKAYVNKKEYDKCIKRINSLYLDGVERIQKKSKLNSCSCSPIQTKNISDEIENKCNIKSNKSNKRKKNRNIYYKQIQWKKKIMLENMKKKQENEYLENYECSFRPQIIKRNISQLFKKDICSENETSYKKNRSYFDIYFGNKQREINKSKKKYFIFNINDIYKYNNKTFFDNYKDKKEEKRENRYKYDQENIKLSLIQRKLYNLEKFFSKHNL